MKYSTNLVTLSKQAVVAPPKPGPSTKASFSRKRKSPEDKDDGGNHQAEDLQPTKKAALKKPTPFEEQVIYVQLDLNQSMLVGLECWH